MKSPDFGLGEFAQATERRRHERKQMSCMNQNTDSTRLFSVDFGILGVSIFLDPPVSPIPASDFVPFCSLTVQAIVP